MITATKHRPSTATTAAPTPVPIPLRERLDNDSEYAAARDNLAEWEMQLAQLKKKQRAAEALPVSNTFADVVGLPPGPTEVRDPKQIADLRGRIFTLNEKIKQQRTGKERARTHASEKICRDVADQYRAILKREIDGAAAVLAADAERREFVTVLEGTGVELFPPISSPNIDADTLAGLRTIASRQIV